MKTIISVPRIISAFLFSAMLIPAGVRAQKLIPDRPAPQVSADQAAADEPVEKLLRMDALRARQIDEMAAALRTRESLPTRASRVDGITGEGGSANTPVPTTLNTPAPVPPPLVTVPGKGSTAPGQRLMSTYTVTSTADAGPGSLRQAIIDANASFGPDVIEFNIGGGGLQTIGLFSGLDVITEEVLIDGWSQGGGGYTGTPLIVLDGTSAPDAWGFNVQAPGVVIRGFSIVNFPFFSSNAFGIGLFGGSATGCRIYGNHIGVDPTGTADAGNRYGIWIGPGANGNLVGTDENGTDDTAERNIVSGNADIGILIESNGNSVAGNIVGTDITATTAIANWNGVWITGGGSSNVVGGSTPAGRNVVSGNVQNGVIILAGGTGNIVKGNYIGTNGSATGPVTNGHSGVVLYGVGPGNVVGGSTAAERNIISGNTLDGVGITATSTGNYIRGNYIGTDAAGAAAIPNMSVGVRITTTSTLNVIGGSAPGEGNLVSGNLVDGILIDGAGCDFNVIAGNFIGTDAPGTAAIPNGAAGVAITGGSSGNFIGGAAPGEGNLISGNTTPGIFLLSGAEGTMIRGNRIGTNAAGTGSIPNGWSGIDLYYAGNGNIVGGGASGEGNLISGNSHAGVMVRDNSGAVQILGNSIGVDADGGIALSNGWSGVAFVNVGAGNEVGGTSAGSGNLISGNLGHGIDCGENSGPITVRGNKIGTNIWGTTAIPNGYHGVQLYRSQPGSIIGGSAPGAGNLLSGNGFNGVSINHVVGANTVAGNLMGTDAWGTAAIPNGWNGIEIYASGPGNVVGGTTPGERNILSGNTFDGIFISDTSTGNFVIGNYIGTDVTGTAALANGSNGAVIEQKSTANIIGGPTAAERNIISGNNAIPDDWGVVLDRAGGNTIQNNYVGTDVTGSVPLGNGVGIVILGGPPGFAADANIIEGNVVSASFGYFIPTTATLGNGIVIHGVQSFNNVVRGNFIGTDATGTVSFANTSGGVFLRNGAHHNTIGGATAADGNLISGNGNAGVRIVGAATSSNTISANTIGLDASGAAPLPNLDGVRILNGPGNTVGGDNALERNIISGNTGIGVVIEGSGATGNAVLGNYIGTDPAGAAALSNAIGLEIGTSASLNFIGGAAPGEGNLISGNSIRAVGLSGGAHHNSLLGNLVGTNHDGTSAIPNGYGVYLTDAPSNNIGDGAGGGNVISGNAGDGIGLWNAGTTGTKIFGNKIGVQADGVSPLGNNGGLTGGGVAVRNSASGNTIGGNGAGEAGNIIANNSPDGVVVFSGSANEISVNAIYDNSGPGIDLEPADGVTMNDPLDADAGGNDLQNFPVIDFAASDLEAIAGTLHGTPSTTFRLEFFTSATGDPSGYGEGQAYVGSASVTTDAAGNADFFETFPGGLFNGQIVTATATDPAGSTSEFSGGVLTAPKFKIFGEHFVVNTTFSGIPLHWTDGEAIYSVSTTVPSLYRPEIVAGLNTWSALAPVTYADGGDTPSPDWGGGSDGINNLVWMTSGWEAATEAPPNAIAVTRVRYNALTGEFTDADIAYNAEYFTWSTVDDVLSADMNVQNVTSHEAGHFGGLGDIYNPGDPGYVSFMGTGNQEQTMYGLIADGEFKKNDLNTGDLDGLDYTYSHIPADRADVVLVFEGSAAFAATRNGFTPSKNAAVELIDKMRLGDKVSVVRVPDQVVFPLTTISGSASRSDAKNAISGILDGGANAIGDGLLEAQAQLTAGGAPNHAPAVILFSSAEEDTLPGAFSVLPTLSGAGTRVYTMGFEGSTGQIVSDSIASATGGAYYFTADTAIGMTVEHIWNRLTGQVLIADTTVSSANVPGYPQPGLKWQGAIDAGIGRIQPGLKWQGSDFLLTLTAPDASVIDPAVANASPTDGIEYVAGPTYNYYNITNPMAGTWTLEVQGIVYPPAPEPLNLYIIATKTDLTMDMALDNAIYAPGDPFEISTSLIEGGVAAGDGDVVGGTVIKDATVTADIYPPDGTTETAALAYTGDGRYTAPFPNTDLPGSYRIEINASKPGVFQRKITQSVFVTSPFTCPTNMVVTTDEGECTAVVEYAIEASPGVTVTCTPPSGSAFPVGTTTVVCVGSGSPDTCRFTVTVLNPPPVAAISGPASGSIYPVGAVVNLSGSFTDNAGDVHTATWLLDGQAVPGTVNELSGAVTAAYIPTTAGVYSLRLVVADQCGAVDTAAEVGGLQAMIVVYDPDAGFVTGGGWINSPPGAYPPDPLLTGKAGFGFVSKYYKGKLIPSGQTEFHFKAADFRFQSSSYEWLVIAGARAQYKGSGRVNDAGDYKFILTATDGQVSGGGGTDRIRVKIWDRVSGAIVYDNQPGDPDTSAPATALGGGSIVIHNEKISSGSGDDGDGTGAGVPDAFALFQNYPNPFNPVTSIRYAIPVESRVLLRVFNALGELVATIDDAAAKEAGYHAAEFDGGARASGVYFFRLDAVPLSGPAEPYSRTLKMLLVK